MKIYKSTRAKNAIEKGFEGLKYSSCTKREDGLFDVVFEESESGIHHCFVCDFSDKMILIERHSIGVIKFVETEIVSDTLQAIRG